MEQIRYNIISASNSGITCHPIKQMNNLGYNLIAAVPQTVADQWWFTVEKVIEPLPDYLEKMA